MGSSLKTFLTDLYLILGAIIGMGFATGKEIKVFFVSNKTLAFFSLFVFLLFYIFFFYTISKYVKKNNVKSFKDFNKQMFNKHGNIVDIILIVIYSVCASAMLAGMDSLIQTVFNVYVPFSLALSIVTFFMVVGGIERIKKISLKLMPVLLFLIFLNLFVNSFEITNKFLKLDKIFYFGNFSIPSFVSSFTLPLLFLGGNFILAINSVINLKTNNKFIITVSSIIFFVFIFLGIIVVCNDNVNFMPFLESSKSLSFVFFVLYLLAIVIALISSLVISTHSMYSLTNKKNSFTLWTIIFVNQMLSFFGIEIIIKYLYAFSGLLGLIYLIIIIIKILNK